MTFLTITYLTTWGLGILIAVHALQLQIQSKFSSTQPEPILDTVIALPLF
jgi:hypothetical protein